MLVELRVENLLLIERAELRLDAGLNVITGETGAGKTVLAHALDLLLGGRPRAGIVRPGADEAYVEGLFAAAPGALAGDELGDLRERLADPDADEVLLARRVGANGRTRAFVDGRSASAADLAALGPRLVSFYGQHEHRRLVLASAQLEILDSFCGDEQLRRRERCAAAHRTARALAAELELIRDESGERERDLLAFELDEIDALDPSPDDERRLLADRGRLRQVDALREASLSAAEALAPEASDAAQPLAQAARAADLAAGADPRFDALGERLRALAIEADELARDLRSYEADLDADPARLDEVERRLSEYDRLERKHGGSLDALLAHAERSRARLADLAGAEQRGEELAGRLEAARSEHAALADDLHAARAAAAHELSARVRGELAQLAMADSTFEVVVERAAEPGPTGFDRVELLLAPNPGVPPTPLRETASGGELSRAMLALLTAARGGELTTLVFDEVDAGIGGQTARAVGERLRTLARTRQVISITHLPQIASLADRHFRIEKLAGDALARTSVTALDRGEVIGELCRMLGADVSDAGARRHAEELIAA